MNLDARNIKYMRIFPGFLGTREGRQLSNCIGVDLMVDLMGYLAYDSY